VSILVDITRKPSRRHAKKLRQKRCVIVAQKSRKLLESYAISPDAIRRLGFVVKAQVRHTRLAPNHPANGITQVIEQMVASIPTM
jgi:hypothetical protein